MAEVRSWRMAVAWRRSLLRRRRHLRPSEAVCLLPSGTCRRSVCLLSLAPTFLGRLSSGSSPDPMPVPMPMPMPTPLSFDPGTTTFTRLAAARTWPRSLSACPLVGRWPDGGGRDDEGRAENAGPPDPPRGSPSSDEETTGPPIRSDRSRSRGRYTLSASCHRLTSSGQFPRLPTSPARILRSHPPLTVPHHILSKSRRPLAEPLTGAPTGTDRGITPRWTDVIPRSVVRIVERG